MRLLSFCILHIQPIWVSFLKSFKRKLSCSSWSSSSTPPEEVPSREVHITELISNQLARAPLSRAWTPCDNDGVDDDYDDNENDKNFYYDKEPRPPVNYVVRCKARRTMTMNMTKSDKVTAFTCTRQATGSSGQAIFMVKIWKKKMEKRVLMR